DSWVERRRAVREASVSAPIDQVLPLVQRVAESDADVDVRAAAVRAVGQLEPDLQRAVAGLVAALADPQGPIRLSGALSLLQRPELPLSSQDNEVLWRALVNERELAIQAALVKLVLARQRDHALVRAESLLDGYDLPSVRAGALIVLLSEEQPDRPALALRLSAAAGRLGRPTEAFELDRQRLEWAESLTNALNEVMDDPSISDVRVSLILLWLQQIGSLSFETAGDVSMIAEHLAGGVAAWATDVLASEAPAGYGGYLPPSTLTYAQEEVAEALEGVPWLLAEPPQWPDAAIAFLEQLLPAVPEDTRPGIVDALWLVLPRVPRVAQLLFALQGVEGFFDQLPHRATTLDRAGLGRALLVAEEGPYLEQVREHAAAAGPLMIELLHDPEWRFRQQAADWIGKRAARLDSALIDQAAQELARLRDSDPDTDVQNSARAALIEVTGQRRTLSTLPLVVLLRGGDEEKALEALEALDRLPGADAPRAMVGEWVTWLALGERATLVESAAEKLRRKPTSVLPLLDHLAGSLPLDGDLQRVLTASFTPSDILALIDAVRRGQAIPDLDRIRLRKWLGSFETGIARSTAVVLSSEGVDKEELDACIAHELESRRRQREVEVHRRLSRHLMEMSEARFYEGDEATFASVTAQMRLHAVPLLARRLQSEEDVDIRENIARTLGNLGGRAAVDALARAVAGEERTRASRQDLLSRYYLEPSKERSDEAARILTVAVADARQTLRVLQVLNFLFAGVGLVFLAAGFGLLLFSDDPQLRFAGGAISVVSFFGLVIQVIREPLDRIQDALNRLVQVETAFTSFIWELNLNGTFIQSQYVANGILSNAEITDTVDRIEGAMRLSMDLVSTYADQGATRVIPAIVSVSPGILHDGDRVRVRGRWLSGGRSTKRPQGGQVQIDHRQAAVGVLGWTDSEVEFRFTRGALGTDVSTGVHWLSLSVDGWETNALPVQVVLEGDAQPSSNGAVSGRVAELLVGEGAEPLTASDLSGGDSRNGG
ncbi:MAG TPA: hypothetical protein VHK28_10495, partial [Candidatus Limnocylindria bacterium]|nr:hypothetical protein [Candidatus Limnocylindria bacterium]